MGGGSAVALGAVLAFASPDDPVEFLRTRPPEGAIVVRANYSDNPFLPDELREEMEYDRAGDPETFSHVWLGEYKVRSDAQIFAGRYVVEEFDPTGFDGPFFGADFGFAQDPTVLV